MKKTLLYILIICLFPLFNFGQQNPTFSHINQKKLFFNPAFAGTESLNNLIIGHRNHPVTSFGDFSNYYLAYNQTSKFLHGGFGFQIINDLQAQKAISKITAGGIYAYHFQIRNDLFAKAAIEPSFTQISVNKDKLTFPNMFDPYNWELMDKTEYTTENLSKLNHHYIDFNAGVLLTYKNYYIRTYREINAGFSVKHINQPRYHLNYPEAKINRQYSFYFDMTIGLMKKKTVKDIPLLKPVFLFQSGEDYQMLLYGFFIKYLDMNAGFLLRNNLMYHYIDPIIYAGFNFSSFGLNYSYDLPLGNKMEKNFISGAHEVTLTIDFQYKGKNKLNKQ
jgi:type IX secretion system PorP/SprF family membrane protein